MNRLEQLLKEELQLVKSLERVRNEIEEEKIPWYNKEHELVTVCSFSNSDVFTIRSADKTFSHSKQGYKEENDNIAFRLEVEGSRTVFFKIDEAKEIQKFLEKTIAYLEGE